QLGGLKETGVNLTREDFELVEQSMDKALTDQRALLEKRVVFLATTASSAPFMGLLGTVVGIMDSFWSIGEQGSASLAIVAPGIAEALLATIVGLGAAIPAVMAYNWANHRVQQFTNEAYGFMLAFINQAKKEQL
ncbi:MAG: Tol-Pal system subunit TolQ, partial [Candidatus Zixiibacteriota bacterium]